MQSAEEILQEKLSKKVLSNKTTREGLLACMIVTLQKYMSGISRTVSEEEIRLKIYDQAYEAFQSVGGDFEFPNLDDIKRVKQIVEKKTWLQEVQEREPSLFAEYERTCQTLFEKYEG
jgi:hypothetical protein